MSDMADVLGARIFLKGIKQFQDAKEAGTLTDPAEVIANKLADLDELTDGDGFTYSWFDMDRADLARELAAALSAAGFGPVQDAAVELAKVTDLVRDMIDPDDCHFDHHGGCQAHGYLSLQIGELCPQLEAKAWLHNREASS